MGCFLDPWEAPRAPARFNPSVDCCLSVFRSIFSPGEGGGGLAARRRHRTKIWVAAARGHFHDPRQPPSGSHTSQPKGAG